MAGLFAVPERAGKTSDAKIAKRANSKNNKSATTVRGGGDLAGSISMIRSLVETNLGYLREEHELIQDKQRLHEYITICIEQNVIAIDTETTGLDPILDNIVGVGIYTPGEKAAYIPIHHRSYVTQLEVANQLSESDVAEELQRVVDSKIDVLMFNAVFDIRVIKNHGGTLLNCTWDCYLAARVMNENEGKGNNGLKRLHQKYVLNGEGDAFKFDDLFKGISFDLIPIQTAYLYAAHDPKITYELYDFQRKYLYYDPSEPSEARNGMNGVAWEFLNIEMPCVPVVAEMEDNGVAFDLDCAKRLHDKYTAKSEKITDKVYSILNQYSAEIATYRAKNPNNKLSDPINIDSPVQLAILLYDILKVDVVDKSTPRGTGEEILTKIDLPICGAILEHRTVDKLLSTYIDKLPNCVNPKDGRIRCKFNQYGADTGRFSSSDPNLQNIPSENHDIRQMFMATSGYTLMPSDYIDGVECIAVDRWCEVETADGWQFADKINCGDTLKVTDGEEVQMIIVKNVVIDDNQIVYYVN